MAGAERLEVSRTILAPAAAVFAVLTDPQGHVTIDSSGMLMSASGDRVGAVGDRFVVQMDREALGDVPLGLYAVTVVITAYEPDREIAWTVDGVTRPPIEHVFGYRLEPSGEERTLVTSYYDWNRARQEVKDRGIFPVVAAGSLRASLGILARTVQTPVVLESGTSRQPE